MSDDRMTAAEYRVMLDTGEHVDLQKYDSAVAVDPGTTTGVAYVSEEGDIYTQSADFFETLIYAQNHSDSDLWIVEAPYLTKWGKTQSGPRAYSSGKVAREAELLVKGLNIRGCDVREHDPRNEGSGQWTGKWDSDLAHRIVGDWEGPDNEHTRDALKLLFIYGFIG